MFEILFYVMLLIAFVVAVVGYGGWRIALSLREDAERQEEALKDARELRNKRERDMQDLLWERDDLLKTLGQYRTDSFKTAVATLEHVAENGYSDETRMAAAREILDRIGVSIQDRQMERAMREW